MHGYGQFRTRRSRSVDLSVLSSFNHHQSPHPHLFTSAKETATQFGVFNTEEEEAAGGGGEEDEQNLGRVVLCRRKSCVSTEKVLKGHQMLGRAFSMRRVSSVSFPRRATKWGSYSRIHDQIEAEPSSPVDGVSMAKNRSKILMFCKRFLGLKY
ncbi:unnamed protein product [Victoria cruziana]